MKKKYFYLCVGILFIALMNTTILMAACQYELCNEKGSSVDFFDANELNITQQTTLLYSYREGELYLKLKKDNRVNIFFSADNAGTKHLFRNEIAQFGITSIQRAFPRLKGMSDYYRIKFDANQSPTTLIDALQRHNFVEFAERVPKHKLFLTPNDIHPDQYNVLLTNCEQAWDITTGSTAIKIGMVDDAVRTDHEDLAANIWTNPGEIAGNGIDDDSNGYVDDVNGWDPASNDNDPNPEGADNFSFSHGTHCAGIAAAATNNGIGVASVGYNVSLVPVKTATDGSGSIAAGMEGVEYAITVGVDVISMSWGGGAPAATEQAVFDEAYAAGIVCVAAAGNDNVSDPMYPASYEHVISVAAIDENDQKASFTNYGATIDVSSPGVQIWSPVATSTSSYEFYDGTSMACPFVSGLCALMLSHDPGATVDRIEECLKTTADDIYGINPTFVGQLGAGRINAYEAVKCTPSVPVAAFSTSAVPPCAGEVFTFLDNSSGTDLVSWAWTFENGTPATSTEQNPTVSFPANGTYEVTLIVTNALGANTLTQEITVAPPSATIEGDFAMLLGYIIPSTITFTGSPPYSITYSDANGTTATIDGITENPYSLPLSPTNSTTYTLVEMHNNSCTGTVSGSANYVVLIPDETNDLCINALPFPNLTIDVQSCVNGTTTGSLAELPYINQSACGATDVSAPAADVWYTFTAVANIVDIALTFEMDTAVVSIYEGSCAGMIGRYCDVSYDGTLNTTFAPADPGTTYYIQVSGGSSGDQGNFTLCLDNYGEGIDQICMFGQSLTVSPLPILGTYAPGQAVTFCLTVDGYNQNSADWLHGIVPTFGIGWDLSSLTNIVPADACNGSLTDEWDWYTGLITSDGGNNAVPPVGPGFFFETAAGSTVGGIDNNPGNNFGDSNNGTCPWTFCFTISTVIDCPPGAENDDLSVRFDNYSDSETGSWGGGGTVCDDDPEYEFKARLSCCPIPQMTGIYPSCLNANGGAVTATPSGGVAPFEIVWSTGFTDTLAAGQSSTISGLSQGFYIVTVTDDTGCVSEASFTLTNSGSIPITISPEATICPNGAAQLQVSGTNLVDFDWFPASSLDYNHISNPTASPDDTTTYFVIATDVNGCSAYASVTVNVLSSPNANAGNNATICAGANKALQATGGVSYAWSPTADLLNPNSATPVSSPDHSTWYTVTVTGANGCTASDSVLVFVANNPYLPPLNIDTTICSETQAQVELALENAISTYHYQWIPPDGLDDPNSPHPIATIDESITYTVFVTTQQGCQATTDVTIEITDQVVELNLPDVSTCPDAYTSLDAGQSISYLWSTGATTQTILVGEPGFYSVTLTDPATGCAAFDTIAVSHYSKPTPTIIGDLTFIDGFSTQLSTSELYPQYAWSTGVNTPEANVTAGGSYVVTVTNADGCTGTAVVTVEAIVVSDYLLPSAFSPNNDDINDEFKLYIPFPINVESAFMQIYDRWGQKVFESNTYTDGWNGQYKGQECGVGVYAYYGELHLTNGETKVFKGNVTLIR